jgi:diaminopimelate epimerase
MSGAGNDFLVLEAPQAARVQGALEEWTRRVCRRGLSVGADGVLVVSRIGEGRIGVRFLNPDGSGAFCGNGSRCAARYASVRGLAGPRMVLETAGGDVRAEVGPDAVRLVLPAPQDRGEVALDLAGERLCGRRVDAGSPHFVVFVETSVAAAPLERWGPLARRHAAMGEDGANVDVAAWLGPRVLALRTWERGVEGETLACGSGAVATAFAAALGAGSGGRLTVVPASGVPLGIELPGPPGAPEAAVLEGDARFVFEGEVDAEATSGFPPDVVRAPLPRRPT